MSKRLLLFPLLSVALLLLLLRIFVQQLIGLLYCIGR